VRLLRLRRAVLVRSLIGLACAALLGACTGPGIDAGENGGTAFITFMLLLAAAGVLFWLFLGRED
jgi:hypothetical protein